MRSLLESARYFVFSGLKGVVWEFPQTSEYAPSGTLVIARYEPDDSWEAYNIADNGIMIPPAVFLAIAPDAVFELDYSPSLIAMCRPITLGHDKVGLIARQDSLDTTILLCWLLYESQQPRQEQLAWQGLSARIQLEIDLLIKGYTM